MKKVNLGEILTEGRALLPPADLYLLTGSAFGLSKEFILAHPEHLLERRQVHVWECMVRRRLQGEPAACIVNKKEFYGMVFSVKNTLIPRPETEMLVDEVLRVRPGNLLDIGTGSGAIPVAVAAHHPECAITAVDVDVRALRTARLNARWNLGPNHIRFLRSDCFSALKGELFEMIVSNPPYLKTEELHAEPGLRFEPGGALDGGPDGLACYRKLLGSARGHLSAGGQMILEITPGLLEPVLSLCKVSGWEVEKVERDLAGLQRMLVLS
jgi:release factor glutamine methyltransferase